MTWEIADSEHPSRAGPRYDQLARVSEEIERCEPRDRFYVRWVDNNGQTDERMTGNG